MAVGGDRQGEEAETVKYDPESLSLLSRARAALQALSEGKLRTVSGLDAVKDLQHRLGQLADNMQLLSGDIDLRQVQESLIEHAAMYTSAPQVLGSMIQLVFCLDHIHTWLEQRDLAVSSALADLDNLRDDLEGQNNLITEIRLEVKACTMKAAAMELEFNQQVARPVDGSEGRHPSKNSYSEVTASRSSEKLIAPMSPSSQHSPMKNSKLCCSQMQAHTTVEVDLQALESVAENQRQVEELQRENFELRSKLVVAAAETADARGAAEAAQTAAEQTAAAAAQVAAANQQPPPAVETIAPAPSTPLEVLEQLEPMLAGLPVGVVPGMSELQEKACDAYGHLRSVLMVAASGVPAETAGAAESLPLRPLVLAGLVPSSGAVTGGLATALPSTWRSTSIGTSDEQMDTWRQATLNSEPIHGIGGGAANGVGGGRGGVPRLPQRWAQESRGGLLRANRLS